MESFSIGMTCNFCGNMPSHYWKLHPINALYYLLRPIWTQLNTEEKCLKSFLRSSKSLQSTLLFKESYHCIYSLKKIRYRKSNRNSFRFRRWSYSCHSYLWRILTCSQLWKNGFSRQRCYCSLTELTS